MTKVSKSGLFETTVSCKTLLYCGKMTLKEFLEEVYIFVRFLKVNDNIRLIDLIFDDIDDCLIKFILFDQTQCWPVPWV